MHGSYTIASDVWSFGILMREVFSNGTNPYPEMTNDIVKKKVYQSFYRSMCALLLYIGTRRLPDATTK